MTRKATRARTVLEGACGEPVDNNGGVLPLYCARPDNGSGLCNVHQAARERGRRQRASNRATRRLLTLHRRKGPTA